MAWQAQTLGWRAAALAGSLRRDTRIPAARTGRLRLEAPPTAALASRGFGAIAGRTRTVPRCRRPRPAIATPMTRGQSAASTARSSHPAGTGGRAAGLAPVRPGGATGRLSEHEHCCSPPPASPQTVTCSRRTPSQGGLLKGPPKIAAPVALPPDRAIGSHPRSRAAPMSRADAAQSQHACAEAGSRPSSRRSGSAAARTAPPQGEGSPGRGAKYRQSGGLVTATSHAPTQREGSTGTTPASAP
mmetsp:Transcript_4534/g.11001  ORF Transcript_4534/g.11001 Transcript_4534/m.11001 type:complete len:244 (-) Transcript_4534:402-1133(-)